MDRREFLRKASAVVLSLVIPKELGLKEHFLYSYSDTAGSGTPTIDLSGNWSIEIKTFADGLRISNLKSDLISSGEDEWTEYKQK